MRNIFADELYKHIIKIIVNIKNFGQITSPYHGYLSSTGDAMVVFTCDLQDPPELISEFIRNWELGYKVVVGVKNKSEENPLMFFLRKTFYKIINYISEINQILNYVFFHIEKLTDTHRKYTKVGTKPNPCLTPTPLNLYVYLFFSCSIQAIALLV